MANTSALKFGRTDSGYVLRVEGRGTMQQSKPAEAFVLATIAKPDVAVVVDLSACDYLDSTFLGCLMGLRQQYASQFRVSAPPDVCRKLFGPTRLDGVIGVSPHCPNLIGEYAAIPLEAISKKEIARHIMECHRRLAEIPGPNQNAFAAIARQMASELETRV